MTQHFFIGLLSLSLLAACRQSGQDKSDDPADPHAGAMTVRAPEADLSILRAGLAQLRAVKPSGNIDHDLVNLLLAHTRFTARVTLPMLAAGYSPALRTLADSLDREARRDIPRLVRLAARTHLNASEDYGRQYQDFTQQVQAALDSAGRYARPATRVDREAMLRAVLDAHLRTGLVLAQEGVSHGGDPKLIALAHRLHHTYQRHRRQVLPLQ